jgi:CRISPR-associated protein Cmr1
MKGTQLNIVLKTLTPLWTGGVDGTTDCLHETGIIGSLRWWYEVIVRGLGGRACDPTSENRCVYDQKKGLESVCHVCQLFGCTGLGRAFRLEARDFDRKPLWFVTTMTGSKNVKNIPNNKWWIERIFEKPTINELCTMYGEGELLITTKRYLPENISLYAQLLWLVNWIIYNAGLSRKIQNGFGQVKWGENLKLDKRVLEEGQNNLHEFIKMPARSVKTDGPTLKNFFNLSYEIKDKDPGVEKFRGGTNLGIRFDAIPEFVPCAYDIRYVCETYEDAMAGLRWNLKNEDKHLARKIFGEMGRTSCVNVSHLIEKSNGRYSLRIFGFLPPDHKEKVLQLFRNTIHQIFPLSEEIRC